MASISSSLRQINSDLGAFVPDRLILGVCRAQGHRWRQRMLGPLQTLHLFILQVLNFNTAMIPARRDSSGDGLWCGLRTYLVDGSSTIAPDTPDSTKAFGQPKGRKDAAFPCPRC